jgi:hypothetical protein
MAATDKTTYKLCPQCQGTLDPGLISDSQGGFLPNPTCPTCNGSGYVPSGKIESIPDNTNEIAALQEDMTKALRRLKKIMDNLGIGDD